MPTKEQRGPLLSIATAAVKTSRQRSDRKPFKNWHLQKGWTWKETLCADTYHVWLCVFPILLWVLPRGSLEAGSPEVPAEKTLYVKQTCMHTSMHAHVNTHKDTQRHTPCWWKKNCRSAFMEAAQQARAALAPPPPPQGRRAGSVRLDKKKTHPLLAARLPAEKMTLGWVWAGFWEEGCCVLIKQLQEQISWRRSWGRAKWIYCSGVGTAWVCPGDSLLRNVERRATGTTETVCVVCKEKGGGSHDM